MARHIEGSERAASTQPPSQDQQLPYHIPRPTCGIAIASTTSTALWISTSAPRANPPECLPSHEIFWRPVFSIPTISVPSFAEHDFSSQTCWACVVVPAPIAVSAASTATTATAAFPTYIFSFVVLSRPFPARRIQQELESWSLNRYPSGGSPPQRPRLRHLNLVTVWRSHIDCTRGQPSRVAFSPFNFLTLPRPLNRPGNPPCFVKAFSGSRVLLLSLYISSFLFFFPLDTLGGLLSHVLCMMVWSHRHTKNI